MLIHAKAFHLMLIYENFFGSIAHKVPSLFSHSIPYCLRKVTAEAFLFNSLIE